MLPAVFLFITECIFAQMQYMWGFSNFKSCFRTNCHTQISKAIEAQWFLQLREIRFSKFRTPGGPGPSLKKAFPEIHGEMKNTLRWGALRRRRTLIRISLSKHSDGPEVINGTRSFPNFGFLNFVGGRRNISFASARILKSEQNFFQSNQPHCSKAMQTIPDGPKEGSSKFNAASI